MIKVKKGQDPYSVIGQYIRDHVSAIEDMIAVIEIDGKTSNELFLVDMTVDGYFIWKSDWYEGGENIVLIDFFPVSDACNPKDHWIPITERPPEVDVDVLVTEDTGGMEEVRIDSCWVDGDTERTLWYTSLNVTAWMPLPEPYKGEE